MLTHLLLNIDGSVELYPIFSSMIKILTINCVKNGENQSIWKSFITFPLPDISKHKRLWAFQKSEGVARRARKKHLSIFWLPAAYSQRGHTTQHNQHMQIIHHRGHQHLGLVWWEGGGVFDRPVLDLEACLFKLESWWQLPQFCVEPIAADKSGFLTPNKRTILKNLKSEQRGCVLSLHLQHTNRQPFEAVHRSFQFIQNNWSSQRTSNCHLSRKKRNTLHYNFQVPIVFTLEPCLTKLEAEITLSPVTREDKQQGWKKNGEKWKPGKGKIILLRMVRILKMENEFWEQKSLLTKTISGLGVKRVGSTIFDNASYRTPCLALLSIWDLPHCQSCLFQMDFTSGPIQKNFCHCLDLQIIGNQKSF